MSKSVLAAVFVCGTITGWAVHERSDFDEIDIPTDIVVQHPQQNSFGVGSTKTPIRLYSVGDTTFSPMPAHTTNATHWIVTINGVNYRGVAHE